MKFRVLIVFALSVVFLPSCSNDAGFSDDILVSLERSACYGECPVYNLKVLKSGIVEYDGFVNVAIEGRKISSITPEQINTIETKLDGVKFFRLKSSLKPDSWGCSDYWSDHSSITIQGSIGTRKKEVYTYLGCESKQVAKVIELADFIDEVAGASKWIKDTNE
ncbi:hypothetical protein NBRC116494_12080 [Aurantivibrio plasticivorans]